MKNKSGKLFSVVLFFLFILSYLNTNCIAEDHLSSCSREAVPEKNQSYGVSSNPHSALEGFDAFVREVQQKWGAPGIAIGIVHKGKPIYLKGFGYRDLENKLPVTPDTLFCIASSTKSFTATGIGILVNERKVKWDTPLKKCLPWFELKDPVASQNATVRDMLSHMTGLPAHWAMQWSIARQYNRREIVRRLRYLDPSQEFRWGFQYQNQMYQVATVVIEELSGQRWEDFTRQRLFEPLEMHRTRFSPLNQSGEEDDVASIYMHREDGSLSRTSYIEPFLEGISGSGSIHSTAKEMCNWLTMNLSNGKFGDRQIIKPYILKALFERQTVIPGNLIPELLHQSYTLGWNAMVYRGRILLNRPGGAPGIASQVILLPAEGIGVVILANLETATGHLILAAEIIDRLLGEEPIPWLKRLWPIEEVIRQKKRKRDKAPLSIAPPTQILEAYKGKYENPGYGTISITHEGGQLFMNFLEKKPLLHFNKDIFEVFQLFRYIKLRFETNQDGDVVSISSRLEPSVPNIVFKRIE